MGKWGGRLYKTNRARDFEHEQDLNVRRRQIYETIDRQGFQWVVVLVAGVGFFLDGYTLFASNIVVPMIAFVYWNDTVSPRRSSFINTATLTGTLIGQVLFGFLADKYGRKKMYGIELMVIIFCTLGLVMSSTGVNDSMNIVAWLVWWRTIVGIGVGADYPLSAVITAEFAPTQHRARMMAAVFFMQPLGQIAGNLVSLIVVAACKGQGDGDLPRTVDIMWRWVVGIGVVPGIVALFFRLAIPETPRFLLEIEINPVKAEFDAANLWGSTTTNSEIEDGTWNGATQSPSSSEIGRAGDGEAATQGVGWSEAEHEPATLNSKWTLSKADIVQYFWHEGNWRTLAGTSLSWLLLDFGYYGIGLSNPHFLAKTWGTLNISRPSPSWMTDERPDANIYDMFMHTSLYGMVILNLGSFVGGLLMIFVASQLNRISLQKYGFVALAALFIALGTMFITTQREGVPAIALYVLGQLIFNFGPNTTTYIIPGEVFPTRYRSTCHGISAAAGKLGSVLVQIFSAYYSFGSSTPGAAGTKSYGIILIIFSGTMILGAVVTHFWVPHVQERNPHHRWWGGKTKTLEELAMGRAGPKSVPVTTRRRQPVEELGLGWT